MCVTSINENQKRKNVISCPEAAAGRAPEKRFFSL